MDKCSLIPRLHSSAFIHGVIKAGEWSLVMRMGQTYEVKSDSFHLLMVIREEFTLSPRPFASAYLNEVSK